VERSDNPAERPSVSQTQRPRPSAARLDNHVASFDAQLRPLLRQLQSQNAARSDNPVERQSVRRMPWLRLRPCAAKLDSHAERQSAMLWLLPLLKPTRSVVRLDSPVERPSVTHTPSPLLSALFSSSYKQPASSTNVIAHGGSSPVPLSRIQFFWSVFLNVASGIAPESASVYYAFASKRTHITFDGGLPRDCLLGLPVIR